MDHTVHTCPNCEMAWFERKLCSVCLFRGYSEFCATCGGSGDAGPADPHECPPPFDRATAEAYLSVCRTGALVSQRTRARIILALR